MTTIPPKNGALEARDQTPKEAVELETKLRDDIAELRQQLAQAHAAMEAAGLQIESAGDQTMSKLRRVYWRHHYRFDIARFAKWLKAFLRGVIPPSASESAPPVGGTLDNDTIGPMRRFYRRHLDRYWFARALKTVAVSLLNRLQQARARVRRLVFVRLTPARVCELASLADYAASRAAPTWPVFSAEDIRVPRPHVVPESRGEVVRTSMPPISIPEMCGRQLAETTVIGASDLVICHPFTLHHALTDLSSDFTSEELHARALINAERSKVVWYQTTWAQRSVERAVSLLASCGSNYAHWLSETLPRLAAIDTLRGFEDIPLLVDAALPPQILESIDVVNVHRRPLLRVAANEPVRVERLLWMDATGFVPFEPRNKRTETMRHGAFSTAAFAKLLEVLELRIGGGDATRHPLFVRRNASYRRLQNASEIEDELVARGFIVIEPEKLSFTEQYRLFSRASTVVGATGAALANLVFMPRDAKIVILASANRTAAYYYWQAMATAVGNSVTYVLGESLGRNVDSVHTDYRIDVADVLDVLTA